MLDITSSAWYGGRSAFRAITLSTMLVEMLWGAGTAAAWHLSLICCDGQTLGLQLQLESVQLGLGVVLCCYAWLGIGFLNRYLRGWRNAVWRRCDAETAYGTGVACYLEDNHHRNTAHSYLQDESDWVGGIAQAKEALGI